MRQEHCETITKFYAQISANMGVIISLNAPSLKDANNDSAFITYQDRKQLN